MHDACTGVEKFEYEILIRLETMIDCIDELPSHTGLFKDTEQWSLQYDTTVQLPTGMYARTHAKQHYSTAHNYTSHPP